MSSIRFLNTAQSLVVLLSSFLSFSLLVLLKESAFSLSYVEDSILLVSAITTGMGIGYSYTQVSGCILILRISHLYYLAVLTLVIVLCLGAFSLVSLSAILLYSIFLGSIEYKLRATSELAAVKLEAGGLIVAFVAIVITLSGFLNASNVAYLLASKSLFFMISLTAVARGIVAKEVDQPSRAIFNRALFLSIVGTKPTFFLDRLVMSALEEGLLYWYHLLSSVYSIMQSIFVKIYNIRIIESLKSRKESQLRWLFSEPTLILQFFIFFLVAVMFFISIEAGFIVHDSIHLINMVCFVISIFIIYNAVLSRMVIIALTKATYLRFIFLNLAVCYAARMMLLESGLQYLYAPLIVAVFYFSAACACMLRKNQPSKG